MSKTQQMLIDLRAIRFLVIEDNKPMRKIIRSVLSGLGARHIFEAASGEEGLNCISTVKPDIVIVDWHMPAMSGADVVRSIRENARTQTMPIIMITAHADKRTIVEAMMTGVNEVLRKPFSPKALYDRITTIILEPRPFVRTKTYFGPVHRQILHAEHTDLLPRPKVINVNTQTLPPQRREKRDPNDGDLLKTAILI